MNTERLTILADHLEFKVDEKKFNISSFFSQKTEEGTYMDVNSPRPRKASEFINSCGTAACVAGWALVLFAPEEAILDHIDDRAQAVLDLEYQTAFDLFYEGMDWKQKDSETGEEMSLNPTAKEASRVVRHLAETGEVDWSIAFSDRL